MFSIIIPSFNRNQEIYELIESLNLQTVKIFEVIIVDDCSSIPVSIDKNYDFDIRVIRNQINQGAAGSRNIGAENAKYEWLLFLDDDDRFANNKCELLEKTIKTRSNINFIYHPAKCEMVNENFTYVTKPFPPEQLTLDNMLLANKIGGMPMMAIKKTFFSELNGLSTELKSLEDYDFVLKLVSNSGFKPAYVDEPLSYCSFHTQRSSVSTNTLNTEIAIKKIAEKYVKTSEQAFNFKLNSLYMLAYPEIMRLSRKAAVYYFKMFKLTKSLKHLIIAIITFISPKLAINLKRFI